VSLHTSVDERRLAAILDSSRSRRAAAARQRLMTLVSALGGETTVAHGADLLDQLSALLADADRSRVWLALAVLRAELPLEEDVIRTARAIEFDGTIPALRAWLVPSVNPLHRGRELRRVEVATDVVLVDVEHTSHTSLATGIQRVARQTVARWAEHHDITLVGWTHDHRAMRRLTPSEQRVALHGGSDDSAHEVGGDERVIVPWRATYVLPELATELHRTRRLLALARYAESRTAVIGFDCVPLSSGETIGGEMGTAFANNLAAVRHMGRVAAISHAAALEYTGWREMLTGVGLPGPAIEPILLPVEATTPSAEALTRARADFLTDAMPLVLCVGSHEPRKNHLAVLHAAELAWRAGSHFNLVFVGGNSWGTGGFRERMVELQRAGRPVESVSALSDDMLWAAYAVARCVLFPSLNEGYGLPVAEALASGTPVITSGFGSMREIAGHGGALLVDPRDDQAIAVALSTLLEDDEAHARLADEARAAPTRTWDEYAADVWEYLVEGQRN
jgi:hypothetical protein